MKKSILMIVAALFIAMAAVAQPRPFTFMHSDTTKYVNTVSLSIEKAFWHSDRDIDFEGVQVLGDGDYLFALPQSDSIVIKTNADKTKAKIVKKNHFLGAPFDMRFSYNIKEDEKRIILWYEDNRTYCGYIYDKNLKACQAFRDVKEKVFRRGMNRLGLKWQ